MYTEQYSELWLPLRTVAATHCACSKQFSALGLSDLALCPKGPEMKTDFPPPSPSAPLLHSRWEVKITNVTTLRAVAPVKC